jgi:hypothetical protein
MIYLDAEHNEPGTVYHIYETIMSEVVYWFDDYQHRKRSSWTNAKFEGDNIFINHSCDCYPNINMLYLTKEELLSIADKLNVVGIVGKKIGNITIESIENGTVKLLSGDPEHIKNGQNKMEISIIFLKKIEERILNG